MNPIHVLDEYATDFPDTGLALTEPNGLLAVGGNLSTSTLITAYRKGIFPWFSEDQPILWWTPSPRMVLLPSDLHISRSLAKSARKKRFKILVDCNFEDVIRACSETDRPEQDGTWITEDILQAYIELHEMGVAHCVEAWQDDTLVGGLYGVALGKAFFGESMFSLISGASKQAFVSLAIQLQNWQFELIDCQIHTDYLAGFGATELPRPQFEKRLEKAVAVIDHTDWKADWSLSEWGYDGKK